VFGFTSGTTAPKPSADTTAITDLRAYDANGAALPPARTPRSEPVS
jgi:hypothetical protein